MLNNFFILDEFPLNNLEGRFDLPSLALSFIIALMAYYVALHMAVHLRRETIDRLRLYWRLTGTVVLGFGIWATHFTGMLAYKIELEHRYHLPKTILSLCLALAVAFIVFELIDRSALRQRLIVWAAIPLGIGLTGMLYLGMHSMEMRATLQFAPIWFIEASLLAMLAMGLTLHLSLQAQQQPAGKERRFVLLSALMLAFIVSTMQYSATQSSVVVPFIDARLGPEFDDVNRLLASAVGAVTLLILGIALAALSLSQKMTEHLKLEVARRTEELQRSTEELQLAKDEAEEASLAKSEFLANMSHEIRTPINAVVGIANILNGNMLPPERHKEYLQTLQISAESLLSLINELLDIAKVETNSIELESAPFDMGTLLEEVMRIISVRATEKGLHITLDYSAQCPRQFIGDGWRIRQILVNLLTNAVKFTQTGGVHIRVAAAMASGPLTPLHISVRDTGIGIPAEKLGSIFEKFVQADSSHTRKYGGTGLGLSISRGLAERMGGSIQVRSTPGIGSEFIVQLNLPTTQEHTLRLTNEQHPLLPPTMEQDSLPTDGTPPARILLVEDNAANILVAKSYLDMFGMPYALAHNGAEAFEKHTRHPFDLILMDVQMPVMDGYEATKRIRAWEQAYQRARTPIIAMTSHGRVEDRERCLKMGMDEYVSKPFRPEELRAKIMEQLEPTAQAS